MAIDKKKFIKKALLVLRNIVIVAVLQVVIYSLNCLQNDSYLPHEILVELSFLCVILPTLVSVLIFKLSPLYFFLSFPVFVFIMDKWLKSGTYLFIEISDHSTFFLGLAIFFAALFIGLLELLIATIVWLIRKLIRRLKKRHKEKLQQTQPGQNE